MARQLLHRRYWDRFRERALRLQPGIQAAWNALIPPPQFIDYWPWVPATLPEKMVFASLIRRRINFYFSYYFGDFPFTPDKYERYRPDFILPDYSVIIEVQGVYWHTRPGMWTYDATRWSLFYAAGWKVYFLTDLQIMDDVDAALETIPEVANATVHGNFWAIGDRPFDPTASVEGRMRKYPKKIITRYKDQIKGRQGVASYWRARTYPRAVPKPIGPLFTPEHLDGAYVKSLEDYGREWLRWMQEMWNRYFRYPEYRRGEAWEQWRDMEDFFKRFRPGFTIWGDPWS